MVDEKKEALDALERLLASTNGLGACEAYTSRAALLTAQDVNAGMLEALKNINTIAALRSGRRFIGIEKDRKWFDVARKRIMDEIRYPFDNTLDLFYK